MNSDSGSESWAGKIQTKFTFRPFFISSVQFSSVAQSCPTVCDPMYRSTPGLPVHHQLPEFTQTHVYRVGDAIQPSHPGSSPSLPAPNPSQHQSLFQWVNSSYEVFKVLELQLQHHSFQRNPRADLLQNGLVGSPCNPRDSQESSATSQFKSINSSGLSLLHSPTLTSIHLKTSKQMILMIILYIFYVPGLFWTFHSKDNNFNILGYFSSSLLSMHVYV